jgi:mono/diheme cytochrome c family protein
MQAMLTLNLWKVPDISTVVEAARAATKARGVQELGRRILQPPASAFAGGGGFGMAPEEVALLRQGEGIYAELCVACHGSDGKGAPVPLAPAGTLKAPSLAGSPRVQAHRDFVIKAVMHGLTGPIEGTTYTDVMVPMGSNNDEWIAAITSYVRNSFGNTGSVVSPADVARVRALAGDRRMPWTVDEIEAALPVLIAAEPAWKASASHNSAAAAAALGNGTWTSGEPQRAGMWFQIELPAAAPIAEIQFTSPPGFGGRGAGAPGAGTGPPQGQGRGRGGVPAPPGSPLAYSIQVSMDGSTWSPPVAEGQGSGRRTVISFKPVDAKFVRITQTGTASDAAAWTLQRLRLFQMPKRMP